MFWGLGGLSMAHKCTVSNPTKDLYRAKSTRQGFLVTLELETPSKAVPARRGGGKRGKVTGFSKASRWRLLKTLAVVRWGRSRMITLTYPSWVGVGVLEKNQSHLRAFVERWYRHYGYRPSFIWKKEYTKADVIHFHLLQPQARWHDDFIAFVSRSWAEILATDRQGLVEKTATKVEFARTSRKAMSYVSKYIAKEQGDLPTYHRGRLWGWVGRDGFKLCEKYTNPIPVSAFFVAKDDLEKRLKIAVWARRIDRLLRWW